MKAHYNRPVSNKMKSQVKVEVGKEVRKQAGDLTRRLFKLFCLALNKQYGFGKDRLATVLQMVNDLSVEKETDEVFWSHVDERMQQIGIPFLPENYELMGE